MKKKITMQIWKN